MSTSDLAPWIYPPPRSHYRCQFVQAVLNVPAAMSAAANAGGLTLAAALGTITPITVLTPTAAERVTLTTITPEARSKSLKLFSWGITVANAPDEALEVSVTGGTRGGLPSAPNPSISSHAVELHQQAHAIITENKTIDIQIRNLTQGGAAPTALHVQVGFCFWEFPVDRFTDDTNANRLRGGYGAC